jgi:ubiquinone/menaquinone biosynthesis C-methylase UbiE
LNFLNIEYIAPGDASHIDLPENSVDFHTSYTVFEHIPPEVIKKILKEGKRVLKNDGLFVHRVDYSDHFSHSDKTISTINFLQFSDSEWDKLAGNKFMYMNRLRHDDFQELFFECNTAIILEEVFHDQTLNSVLETISIHDKYKSKEKDILLVISSWFIAQ